MNPSLAWAPMLTSSRPLDRGHAEARAGPAGTTSSPASSDRTCRTAAAQDQASTRPQPQRRARDSLMPTSSARSGSGRRPATTSGRLTVRPTRPSTPIMLMSRVPEYSRGSPGMAGASRATLSSPSSRTCGTAPRSMKPGSSKPPTSTSTLVGPGRLQQAGVGGVGAAGADGGGHGAGGHPDQQASPSSDRQRARSRALASVHTAAIAPPPDLSRAPILPCRSTPRTMQLPSRWRWWHGSDRPGRLATLGRRLRRK